MYFLSLLASIYGTEQDKVNCSFYFKIGACRHGDRCSRKHIKPQYSQTILVSNVWQNPKYVNPDVTVDEQEVQRQLDEFYEDFFVELAKFGQVIEMYVCDNVGEHLIGNVYARYEWEEEAQRAVDALNDRWYNARPLFAELSPVTDFREACCRQHETNDCQRGGFCNFMHVRKPHARLLRQLMHEQAVEVNERKRAEKQAKAAQSTSSGRPGWKDDVDGEGGGQRTSDWRKASSGGDWRSSGGRERSRSPRRREDHL
jgi:splicing factor U2AF subunit